MGFYTVLLVVHSIIVVFLIMMVLIQRTDSDGLGGLGGGGGNQFLSGRSQANLMTRTTAILAGAFMVTSLVLAVMASHMTSGSIIDNVPAAEESAPVSAPVASDAKKDVAPAAKAEPAKKTVQSKKPVVKEEEEEKEEAPAVPKPE